MKESLSEQAMLNALVADYLCSKAPKIGAKFKKETSAGALEEYQTGLSEMVQDCQRGQICFPGERGKWECLQETKWGSSICRPKSGRKERKGRREKGQKERSSICRPKSGRKERKGRREK